ncbi:Hypothetical protein LUCI_1998 [Lucifera butyrica]|uniref:Uncharacterized protein n=1 Tax=Lucifera butyrica TaxID=1351585 RepID=A0A498R910_9FIRM|nr:hypothetical protein [Lucifera butyrica]VBB06762.1 Hypothetical protein LUCI_1998 [Lucifera butyrica]
MQRETIYFLFYLGLCFAALSSLKFLRRRLHPLELFYGYLVAVICIQQTFTILTINLKMFEMVPTWQAFLSLKIPGMVYYPLVYLWLIFFLLDDRRRANSKALYCLLLFGLLLASDYATSLTRFVIVYNWNIYCSIIRHAGLLLAVSLFLLWLRRQMGKEGIPR